MNSAIASLSEKWQVRGPQDGPAATYPTFDSDGVYRLLVLKVADLEEWVRDRWDGPRDYQLALD